MSPNDRTLGILILSVKLKHIHVNGAVHPACVDHMLASLHLILASSKSFHTADNWK